MPRVASLSQTLCEPIVGIEVNLDVAWGWVEAVELSTVRSVTGLTCQFAEASSQPGRTGLHLDHAATFIPNLL